VSISASSECLLSEESEAGAIMMKNFLVVFRRGHPIFSGRGFRQEIAMKTASRYAAAAAVVFSAVAFAAVPGFAAPAKSADHEGAYCLQYNKGGSDCGFKSFAQCKASASGIGGECEFNVFHLDDSAI
jgi:hypothetical protein